MFTFIIRLSFPKAYHSPGHTPRIVEYHSKKILYLNPRIFVFTVSFTEMSFKDFRHDFTHFYCKNINSSWARSFCSVYLHHISYLLNFEVYYNTTPN
jgi:hypothetical protein